MAGAQKIILKHMHFTAPIDVDSWGRPCKVTQPVQFCVGVTVSGRGDRSSRADAEQGDEAAGPDAAETDVVAVDYSELAALVLSTAGSPAARQPPPSVNQRALQFHNLLAKQIFDKWPIVRKAEMQLVLPVGIHGAAASAVWRSTLTRSVIPYEGHEATLTLQDIHANTMIGLRPHEAAARQTVVTSLRFAVAKGLLAMEDWFEPGWAHAYVREIVETVEASTNKTVEGLLAAILALVQARLKGAQEEYVKKIPTNRKEDFLRLKWLRVEKTDALQFVEGSGVEVEFD